MLFAKKLAMLQDLQSMLSVASFALGVEEVKGI
jgi:hypothetical protein